MKIRNAARDDFSALVPLFKRFATTQEDGLELRFQQLLEHPDHLILVAEIEAKVVGYATVQGYGARLRSGDESTRLNDLLVVAEHRSKGIGSALLEQVKLWCKSRGARYLEWQSSSQGAMFYQKLGLKPEVPNLEYPFFEIDFKAES